MTIIPATRVLGQTVKRVWELDLNPTPDGYINRRVFIELDPLGLVELGQKPGTDDDGQATIEVDVANPRNSVLAMDAKTEAELCTSVSGVFIPYGAKEMIGLSLRNGYVLHIGLAFGEVALHYMSLLKWQILNFSRRKQCNDAANQERSHPHAPVVANHASAKLK
jgi:hypothetical protein